ncbi:TPA: PAAR domain-containing protein [Providencia stuartii]|uniref:PAAR domain-containing protein n=1 Tax=Providencia stuartii TaxID=588 RepID=UPI001980D83C|nr:MULTISPECIES: PAAR domain-containing protein [Providencia]MBN5603054.1 PAAR domain-containing protein [Providencia stuartii]MDF4175726.1 PAAR domain-containing protein [Providencia thailandensis]QUC26431.1 PAAR domain-containing protein [Providencia stuartii]WIJ75578.1 PAAR domain-containing protein [Providencia thailandensis]CAK6616436.1 Zn-binding Pro-Ala-Ala-Arg (PAAR) domain, involved in Type VI secretion [Providencia stuartii]
MRSTVNGRKIILKNDTTNTGGTVLTGSSLAKQIQGVACVGDSVYCPSCKTTGAIVEGDGLMKINGIPVALEGHKVACGCSGGCVLVAVD